jgi:large subunit ribosomal protein L3
MAGVASYIPAPCEPPPENQNVAIELLCRKIGMTRIFTEGGESIAVTVLEAGPNPVVQKKTEETDGYTALQLAFGERRKKNMGKGVVGHYAKAGVAPKAQLEECRVTPEEAAKYEVGQDVKVADVFTAGQRIDVIGTSRGRGTAGVVKRHNFKISRSTHGTHEGFRHGGSIGAGGYPGRVFKGLKMFGRHGNAHSTTRNVRVARIDAARNLLLVHGSVPGHPNAFVRVRSAKSAK